MAINVQAKAGEANGVLKMRAAILIIILATSLSGCVNQVHNSSAPLVDPVDVAVNLGMEHEDDLRILYDALASSGIPCNRRAMSLNAEQIVVNRDDFERARAFLIRVVVKRSLTARLYESPDFAMSPGTSLLEVWEKGRKLREEAYKLYM